MSYVLNNAKEANISATTRKRVLDAADELGYVPNAAAQMLAGQRSRIVGLVFPRLNQHLPSHLFLLPVLDGLLTSVEQNGMRLLIDSVDGSMEDAYMDLVRAKRIDGLVLIDAHNDDPGILRLTQDNFPVVTLGHHFPEFCTVDVDNRGSGRMATEHLIKRGHDRIGCVTNHPSIPTQINYRLEGYKDALNAANIDVLPELIADGYYSSESGVAAMHKLLDLPAPPTAVFVTSDVVAFGAVQAIQERGLRIPEDIAIVGFDDVPLASFCTPPLTTVRMPAIEMGRCAGQLLYERTIGQPKERHIQLDTELVVRASS